VSAIKHPEEAGNRLYTLRERLQILASLAWPDVFVESLAEDRRKRWEKALAIHLGPWGSRRRGRRRSPARAKSGNTDSMARPRLR
jgi:hypothetical protein